MKNKFILGVLIGFFICTMCQYLTYHYFFFPESFFAKGENYVFTKKDYYIGDSYRTRQDDSTFVIAKISKGIQLKEFRKYPEGFTTYILFINIPQTEIMDIDSNIKPYEIRPYWIFHQSKLK